MGNKNKTPNLEALFEEIYLRMYRKLYIYALKKLNDPETSEEAVQDTFRIAWMKFEVLMSSPNQDAWLMQTLKYVLKNISRSKSSMSKLITTGIQSTTSNHMAVYDEIDIDVLYENVISCEDFLLLKKLALEGYTYVRLAEELGISVEACRKRVQKAKTNFKKGYLKLEK